MADQESQKDSEKPEAKDGPQGGGGAPEARPAAVPELEYPFNEDIAVLPGQRLTHLDKGPVKAYRAIGVRKAPSKLYALLCEDYLTPRSHSASKLAAITNNNIVRLVASGRMYWPPEKRERYVFIYENVLGQPLMKRDSGGALNWKPEKVLSSVLTPMISALTDLRDKDIVHGDIRMGNIFDAGTKDHDRLVLGECLASPASYHMPVIYLTVDRGLADPAARGVGVHEDDLYAFGVCLALMLRAHDPLDGMNDEEIIEAKIEQGSYGALTGKDRFTGGTLELLRGLLQDEKTQRWTLEDIQAWQDGRRLSPKQSGKAIKASRPVVMGTKKFLRPELLAAEICRNPTEGTHLIDSGELEQWLQRAVENKALDERVEKALTASRDSGKAAGHTEAVMTRLAIALHQSAPIRYKNVNLMPEGIGPALTEAYVTRKDLQPYVEIFSHYFVMQWIDMQEHPAADAGGLLGRYDSCRAFVRQVNMGFGLERCIYFMNPECQCLSDKLKKFQVRSPEDLMHAYEKMASDPGRPALFMDRHIAAFLSVKDRKNIDSYLIELNSEALYKKILAEMKILATIQKRSRMEKFPGIAGWIAENIDPVYERFHDRELRTKVRRLVDKHKAGGDLSKIAAQFDDSTLYQSDMGEFRRAMKLYYNLDEESRVLQRKLAEDRTYGYDTGRQVSSMISAILAGIVILMSALAAFTQSLGGIF